MYKKNFWANEIAHKNNLTKKQVTNTIELFFDYVAKSLIEDQKVSIKNFGQFFPVFKKARTFTIPQTKQKIQVPKQRVIKFKISKQLKTSMNHLS